MLLDTTEDEVSRVIVQREGIDTENERAATLRHELYLKHPSFFTAAAFYHRFDLLVSDSRYADETFFDCIVPQLLVPMTNRRIEALQSALLVQYQDRYTHPPISTIGHIFGVLASVPAGEVFRKELTTAYQTARRGIPTTNHLDHMLYAWSRFHETYQLNRFPTATAPAGAGTLQSE